MTWDFICDSCNQVRGFMFINAAERELAEAEGLVLCPEYDCGRVMRRLPSAPNFVVNGYNARNGYTK